MIVTKRYTTGSNHIALYKYLLGIKETRMMPLNDFLTMCRRGHVLISKTESGTIVGGSVTYETVNRYFVAHCHIDKEYRKSNLFASYYAKIQTWTSVKDKPVQTSLKSLDGVEKIMKHVSGDVYEIDKTLRVRDVRMV